MVPRFPELGTFTQPGNIVRTAGILDDTRAAEALGLGTIWISERLGVKDAPVMSGAAGAVSTDLRIGTGLLGNLCVRHPMVVASYGASMSLLTGGRFVLGIGRGLDPVADATGTPRITFKIMEAYIDAVRALWRGETVTSQAGPYKLNGVSIGAALEQPPPVLLGAEGDKTAKWAGRVADAVMIQGLWSPEGTAHTTGLIREGAEEAGRDPDEIEILAPVVTACEVTEDELLITIIRRWNTYMNFPVFLDQLCKVNGWDRALMERIRLEILDMSIRRNGKSTGAWGDENVTRDLDDLRRCRELYPEAWLHDAYAIGDRDHCARYLRKRFDNGIDGIVLHGSRVENLAPLLDAWPAQRPATIKPHAQSTLDTAVLGTAAAMPPSLTAS